MLERMPVDTADATAYHDLAGLRKLRTEAREQSPEAIRAVAQQLEGMFLNLMMKSMRQASSAFAEDNPFSSQEVRTFEEMRDQQLSLTMSNAGGIGLARIIERQLSQQAGRRWSEDNQPDISRSGAGQALTQPDALGDLSGYNRVPVRNFPPPTITQSLERVRVLNEPVAPSEATRDQTATTVYTPDVSSTAMQPDIDQFAVSGPIDFVNKIMPFAQDAGRALNVDPMAIVAQAALETGWGKHVMKDSEGQSTFNLFGIKADQRWQGQAVSVWTDEYRNGIAGREVASFRAYPSLQAAFSDYVDFLSSQSRYRDALQAGAQAEQWGEKLQQAGYATDPDYGKKIANIVSRLQKSDAP